MARATLGALARIARRDALRHRGHSLLLVAMLALPVAGLVAGTTLLDTLGRHSQSLPFQPFGSYVVVLFWTLYAITVVAAVLMAGAAVAIAARRQLRALGLLAAAGARGRQLGAVVVLQAATLGLVGVLLGIPAGLLLARALLPRLARAIYLDPISEAGPLLVAPGRLALTGALGLLAATVAALMPAVRAARLPVTEALAARRPPPQLPRWLTVAGIVLVLAGLGLVVLQVWLLLRPWQAWELTSLAAVLVGLAAVSPALVALLGRTARWLPASLRLAVRDLARHPTRSAAAVVAVTAGLAVPMILGALAAQQAAYARAYTPRELRADQVVVNSPAAVAAVAKLLPGARPAPFTTAYEAAGNGVTVHGPVIDQEDIYVNRGLAIGERELLVAMGGEHAAAAFARGAVVAFGLGLVADGQVSLAVTGDPRRLHRISVPAVQVTTAAYAAEGILPSFVISHQTAQRLALPGLATPPRYLVRAARPLSGAQRDQLRGLQTRFPAIYWAEPDPDQQSTDPGTRSVLLALLTAAAIIALGSVAAACALALTEAREDLTTLAQLGAAPAMTRRLMVAEAWLLAGLGALLAVAIGLAPTAVRTLATGYFRPSAPIPVGPSPFAVPWTLLAVVTLAIPALAAAAASLLARSSALLTPPRGGYRTG